MSNQITEGPQEKLDKLKREHGIKTKYYRKFDKWAAQSTDVEFDVTELDAVRALCNQKGIPCKI